MLRYPAARGSLRLRLTVLFAAVTSISIALLGVFLDYSLSSQLAAREREQLHSALKIFRHLLSEVHSVSHISEEVHRFSDIVAGHGELQAAIFLPSGAAALELTTFPWPADLIAQAARGEEAETTRQYGKRMHRLVVAPSPVGQGDQRVLVALAHDTEEDRELLQGFRTTVLLACLLGSLIAGALGYGAASRGLLPLRRMVRAATRIRAESLHERLQVKDAPAEVRDLAEEFNEMLARLELSFQRLSDFSSDLAHELRTPLTNLILHAQVAQDRPRSESELRAVIESSLEELQRLARTVNDMLFLAKADHAQIRLDLTPLRIEEEVAKIFEYFEPLAADCAVELKCDGTAVARADRDMLRRVLANLVSNAIRHAAPQSAVRVRFRTEGAHVAIEVENRGMPLSPEQAARVFDRFFRTEASRSASSEGAGLGLAIVKSIVELHGGEVLAKSEDGRTIFRAAFPSAEGAAPV